MDLGQLPAFDSDSCSDRRPVAFPGAHQAKQHAVVMISSLVEEQGGGLADIDQHDIHIAVIVDVAEGRAAAGGGVNPGEHAGDVVKDAVAMIAKQLERLAITGYARNRV